jgi:hypothetical protein
MVTIQGYLLSPGIFTTSYVPGAADLEAFAGAPINCASFQWPQPMVSRLVSGVVDNSDYQVR